MYEDTSMQQNASRDYEKTSKWTQQDNILLVNALVEQRDVGHGHGVIWTPEAWEAVAEALKGSELVSGGAQKTVRQCKARWQQVRLPCTPLPSQMIPLPSTDEDRVQNCQVPSLSARVHLG